MTDTNAWRERISVDPEVHHGNPCIRGTRVPLTVILGSLADGDTVAEILASYPQLSEEDVRAAIQFAAETVSRFDFVPTGRRRQAGPLGVTSP